MPRPPPNELEEIYFKTAVLGVTYCIPVWGEDALHRYLINYNQRRYTQKQSGLFMILHVTEITPTSYKKPTGFHIIQVQKVYTKTRSPSLFSSWPLSTNN